MLLLYLIFPVYTCKVKNKLKGKEFVELFQGKLIDV